MRKNFYLVSIILFMSVLFSSSAYASPYRYDFIGNITAMDDRAGADAINGLIVGSAVNYSFMVDFFEDGTYTRNNGEVVTRNDGSGYDYFYTDYVGGTALPEIDGGSRNAWYDAAEFNSGWYKSGLQTTLTGLSSDNSISVFDYSYYRKPTDWVVGDAFHSSDVIQSSTGFQSIIWADLTLSSVNPVPVPSAIWLFGSGLLGLVGVARRKKA